MAMANTIAANGSMAVRATKLAVNQGRAMDMDAALALEAVDMSYCQSPLYIP